MIQLANALNMVYTLNTLDKQAENIPDTLDIIDTLDIMNTRTKMSTMDTMDTQ